MNKNILIYAAVMLAGLSSCTKENPAFDKSADERLNETLAKYQDQLAGSATGWKAVIEPAGGGSFGFYLKFNTANRVVMYADYNLQTASTSMESSYRLKALQQPSLIFDTYSYIHLLADPNENAGVTSTVNGGLVGQGLRSDFEFYFDGSSSDTIHLKGRFNGSRATLIRATQAEATRYNNGELAGPVLFNNISRYLEYFLRVTMGGIEYEISVDSVERKLSFSWLDGSGVLQTFTTPYSYTLDGVQLANPLPNGTQTIGSFTDLSWNASATTLGFRANGTNTVVTGFNKPMKVDPGAAQQWWLRSYNAESYYSSYSGFHVNGVDDAFGITRIPGFYALSYWAWYATYSNVPYDLAGYLTINNNSLELNFGSAYFEPSFFPDGRIVFETLGYLGTVPAGSENAFEQTDEQIAEPAGYYIIQKNENTFDMVSAKDGRAWITWVWEE